MNQKILIVAVALIMSACRASTQNSDDAVVPKSNDLGDSFNLPRTEVGFTEFVLSEDAQVIYVSSSEGSDDNSGLSEQQPVRSILKGYSLLRSGYPDWMLLKRGDTFVTGPLIINKSGRSLDERMLIGAYGEGERPRIHTGTQDFIKRDSGNGNGTTGGSHLAVVGLYLTPHKYTGNATPFGIGWLGGGENLLIEDCFIKGYATNVVIQSDALASPKNAAVRRSIIVDAYTNASHSQGLYAWGVDGLTVEENFFDHNGWNLDRGAEATIFNHNVYVGTSNQNVVFRRNISSRASSHGVQVRSGGRIEQNVFIRNAISVLLGGGDPDPLTHINGVSGVITDNLILEGKGLGNDTTRAIGVELTNIGLDGTRVEGNIIAHKLINNSGASVNFAAQGYSTGVGANNITVKGNLIYNWRGPIHIEAPEDEPACYGSENPYCSAFNSVSGLRFENNDFQDFVSSGDGFFSIFTADTSVAQFAGGRYHSPRAANSWFQIAGTFVSLANWINATGETASQSGLINYRDPARSINGYNADLGGENSFEAFVEEMRQQSRTNWRPAYTAKDILNYFRIGFNLETLE